MAVMCVMRSVFGGRPQLPTKHTPHHNPAPQAPKRNIKKSCMKGAGDCSPAPFGMGGMTLGYGYIL
ncbi:hypothetical protein KDK_14960 [Dictyobacter kobayashii]|uniref:Uncharacterized protein n=1 Tax=Dictyobacter kobayashii TaxID=2014872 RepID=A0A402AF31_9CHLR|nr:hypothetical protein KDK_14960 [Dictyobacter kobayashii]